MATMVTGAYFREAGVGPAMVCTATHETLPRVTAVEIEGVGHMAPVTHPDRVNALIERHLERSEF